MAYLNIKNNSIQYNRDGEELIEIDELEEDIKNMDYEAVQEFIKDKVTELTDYRFYAE